MALNVQNAWLDVKARVKNISDISLTQQLKRATIVNDELREEIESSDPASIIKSVPDFVVSSESQAVDNPSDFQNMKADGTGLFLVDNQGNLSDLISKINEGERRRGWFETASGFVINGFQNATIRQKYIPTLTDLTDEEDEFVVGERFRWVVVLGLLVQYYFLKGGFKDQDYQNWLAEYSSALDSMADSIRRSSSVASLEDNNSTYG